MARTAFFNNFFVIHVEKDGEPRVEQECGLEFALVAFIKTDKLTSMDVVKDGPVVKEKRLKYFRAGHKDRPPLWEFGVLYLVR